MGCLFRHKDIQVLYGVSPMPRDALPQRCICGEAISYADDVAFINPTPDGKPPPGVEICPIEVSCPAKIRVPYHE